MSEEEQAIALAQWLDGERHEPPPGLDPEVIEMVYVMRPGLAPQAGVGIDDILAEVTTGPLAASDPAPSSEARNQEESTVVSFPLFEPRASSADTRQPPRGRSWWATVAGGGTAGILAAAAAVLLVASPTLNDDPVPVSSAIAPMETSVGSNEATVFEEKAASARPEPDASPSLAPSAAPPRAPSRSVATAKSTPKKSLSKGGGTGPDIEQLASGKRHEATRETVTGELDAMDGDAVAVLEEEPEDANVLIEDLSESAPTTVVTGRERKTNGRNVKRQSLGAKGDIAAFQPEDDFEFELNTGTQSNTQMYDDDLASEDRLEPDIADVEILRTAALPDDFFRDSWRHTTNPETLQRVDGILSTARTQVTKGQHGAAIKMLLPLISNEPVSVGQFVAIEATEIAVQSGDYRQALVLADRGLKRDSTNTPARAMLLTLRGDAYRFMGYTLEAENLYNEAIRLNKQR